MTMYVKLKRDNGTIINIHSDNIVNLVMVDGIAYIQLGNMDNVKGILL